MFRIERLAAQHERQEFDCGEPALNNFLQRQAGQLDRRGFGKTYVALRISSARVLGFVSLSAGQVQTQHLPPHLKLPRYPAPVLRIGRLGVDQSMQGQGVGQELMAFALQTALEFSKQVGLYAVVVDAKNDKAAAFYAKLGFCAMLDDSRCLYLPLAVIERALTQRQNPAGAAP